MLPLGDAKGSALALAVEILAAALTGAHFGSEASSFFDDKGGPPRVGQVLIALAPDPFSGGAYASGYYSYLWSEVMDADAFAAFREAGSPFDTDVAAKLKQHIYAAGGAHDPAELYTRFRGRMPTVDALLAKRGLTNAA